MLKTYGPGIVWAFLILILSTVSSSTMKLPDFWDLFSLDKAAHAAFYFILYFLWARVFIKNRKENSIYIILLLSCIAYGILLELFQSYILTHRHGDWVDALANGLGVIAGFYYFRRKK